jgi:antitoxin CcdA
VLLAQAGARRREERERRWQEENADFIAAYNRTVETEGLPLEQWRTF